jgi:hypothetical protein
MHRRFPTSRASEREAKPESDHTGIEVKLRVHPAELAEHEAHELDSSAVALTVQAE